MESQDKFPAFPKIARLNRRIVISEKIDGTNAVVSIDDNGILKAGSRSRWITPTDDNYGFAKWVESNKEDLLKLGKGVHYGEWFGQGIQRRYNLDEKRFYLFNTSRWLDPGSRPSCCGVVPVLYDGNLFDADIPSILQRLKQTGSVAVPGYYDPEGVVVWHEKSGALMKYTFDKNDEHKESA